jgi:hypothetical protein
MLRSKNYLIAVGVLLGLNSQALEVQSQNETLDEALITDRPDFTESPQVVPQGRVQIEGGVTYSREGARRATGGGEVLVRVPVAKKVEVRFGLPSYVRQRDGGRSSGLDDSFLGAKLALSPGDAQRKKPALGLLIGATLPTGANAIGEDAYQPEAILSASWELSPKLAFNSNVGYGRPSDGGTRFSQLFGSVSLGFTLSDKWGAFAEVYGLTKADATGKSAKYVDGGVTYLINNDFQLDARLGFGLNNKLGGPDYFTGVGASRRF